MHKRIILFCVILKCMNGKGYNTNFRRNQVYDESNDSNSGAGFVEPIEFGSFSHRFFAGEQFSLPFTSAGDFDFFGSASNKHALFQPHNREEESPKNGFVEPIQFKSYFDGEASQSSVVYSPNEQIHAGFPSHKNEAAEQNGPFHSKQLPNRTPTNIVKGPTSGKSKYPKVQKSAASEVEIFYPKDKVLLPTWNGRPKPYDGYRSASDNHDTISYGKQHDDNEKVLRNHRWNGGGSRRGPQQFRPNNEKEERERKTSQRPKFNYNDDEDDGEHDAEILPRSAGYKYKFDDSLNIPDLVIKKYPYEKEFDDDAGYLAGYKEYKEEFPEDLEELYSKPKSEEYASANIEDLAKNKNCRQVNNDGETKGEICYVCENSENGGTFEQCAYREDPSSKTYYYGGSKSSSSKHPKKNADRLKRAIDFNEPSNYRYFLLGENLDTIHRRTRQPYEYSREYVKVQKRKKYNPSSVKKHPKIKRSGPSYDNSIRSGEIRSDYFERPLHSDYLESLFQSENTGSKKRIARRPKDEYQPFKENLGYYRFGPEYFEEFDGGTEKYSEVNKRNVKEEDSNEKSQETGEIGQITTFKNGDVCKKVKRDSMICMECKNEKTSATYEQCQTASKPKGKNYTFGHKSSYSSTKSRPQRHVKADQQQDTSNGVERKVVITTEKKVFDKDPVARSEKESAETSTNNSTATSDLKSSPTYEVEDKTDQEGVNEKDESEETATLEEEDEAEEKIDESIQSESFDEDDNFLKPGESYNEYIKRMFPEFQQYEVLPLDKPYDSYTDLSHFEDDDDSNDFSNYNDEDESSPLIRDARSSNPVKNDKIENVKSQMEKAFEEFQKRNWSDCVPVSKENALCYNCVSKDGAKNEECFFIEGNGAELIVSPIFDLDRNITITEPPPQQQSAKLFDNRWNRGGASNQKSPKQKGDFRGVERRGGKKTDRKKFRDYDEYQDTAEEGEVEPAPWESDKVSRTTPRSIIIVS